MGSDEWRIIVREYGRHLEGEYVRRRLRVKALGMEEVSVSDLAACRGEWGASMAYIEGRGGFGPFVDEGNDRVATLESLRASLRGLRHMEFDGVASSGCERDSWADASAPSPSWIGTTESGQGGGDQGILGSLRVDEASTLVDTMFIDLIRRVDCDVDSTSSAEAHAHGDPPRIGDRQNTLLTPVHNDIVLRVSPLLHHHLPPSLRHWNPPV